MKFIHFITIIALCVKLGDSLPLMQFIENEDEVLAKDVIISGLTESKSAPDESSFYESHENHTSAEFSLPETHLYPINQSAISQVPFLQDELQENFAIVNGSHTHKIQSFGILSAFNLPWFADLSFHRPDAAEKEALDDIRITVSGELFKSNEEFETTTINVMTQHVNGSTPSTTTTTTVTKPSTTTTKKNSTLSIANVTTVVSTTESIKKKLIEKIAEVAAEPIILTQGVR